jgi:O-antigen/teichoic acid export membrane protein
MAPQWIGRGLFLTASLCSLSAGGVNLLAAWWWVPRMGVMGAVYAQWSALSLALVTNLVLFWVCERDPRRRNPEAGGVS